MNKWKDEISIEADIVMYDENRRYQLMVPNFISVVSYLKYVK